MSIVHRMYAKGWSTEELAQLEKNRKKAQVSQSALIAQRMVYWTYLGVLIFGVIAISWVFIPVLLRLPPLIANLTTALLAGCVAAIFGHVLHTLDELTRGHHVLIMAVAIVSAVGSSLLITQKSLHFGLLFAVVFAILYGYYWKKGYERNKFA